MKEENKKPVFDIDSLPVEETPRRRTWHAIGGLILGVASWIAVFLFPGGDFSDLQIQIWIVMALALTALILCIKGRKVERGTATVGIVVSGALLLFDIIGLIGCFVFEG